MSDQLEKRTWCYAGPPASYDIPGCKCGNNNCVYSEFKDRLWCEICQIDFEPEHWGVFSGPIPFELCQSLGMNFDRVDLVNDKYIAFDGKHDKDGKPIEWELTTREQIQERVESLLKKSKDFMDKAGLAWA